MPIYVYKCKKCGLEMERLEFGEEINQQHKCPKCDAEMSKEFPHSMNFKLKYNPKKDKVTWSDQDYSTTQRYRKDVWDKDERR